MEYSYVNTTKVFFSNKIEDVKNYVSKLGYAKPLIVTGENSSLSFAKIIADALNNKECHILSGVSTNASSEFIENSLSDIRTFSPDVIITVGGGSVHDTGKAIAVMLFADNSTKLEDFTVDGKLAFSTYSDQLFDKEADNPYTPALIIWPSSMNKANQDYLDQEIQRLMTLLGMKTGIYNIESCVGIDGKPYIMEVSPRGGGCKIAELQRLAFGIDLIENEVRAAVGMPLIDVRQTECDGHWCEFVIHARPGQSGIFKRMDIDEDIRSKYVKVIDMTTKEGDMVHPFTGANMSLGDMFLRFDSREEMDSVMARSNEWLKIVLE